MGSQIRSSLSMVVIGALLGYILVGIGANAIEQGQLFGSSGESPEARRYIVSMISGSTDQTSGQNNDIVARAIQQKASQSRQTRIVPLSLTYLGGTSQGKLHVDIYAVQARNSNGQEAFDSFALTLVDGKVVRRE